MNTSEAAAALGSISTPRKASSSRENGKKGGRPRVWSSLELVFDQLAWEERRFEGHFPGQDILKVWRPGQEAEAARYFQRHQSSTLKVSRAAWLFNDSLGLCLAVTEEGWQ